MLGVEAFVLDAADGGFDRRRRRRRRASPWTPSAAGTPSPADPFCDSISEHDRLIRTHSAFLEAETLRLPSEGPTLNLSTGHSAYNLGRMELGVAHTNIAHRPRLPRR